MTTTQEFRLADRQANVAGITRLINRHLRDNTLRRVELRYSTQAKQTLVPAQAKEAINALLREHGLAGVEISVRAIELPIDDALGEHQLRLLHKIDEPAVDYSGGAAAAPDTRGGRLSLLARWFPALARQGKAVGAVSAAAFATAGATLAQPAAMPAVTQRKAAELLQQAVGIAVRADGPTLHAEPVDRVHITVRQIALHQALQPLVDQNPAAAATWIQRLLTAQKLQTTASLSVRYAFVEPQQGEGTELAGGSDVDVQLHRATSAAPTANKFDSNNTLLPGADSHGPTLMPQPTPRPAKLPTWTATARVLGTTEATFERPFVLRLGVLPARFDRAALEAAGFAKRHGAALRVVSQSCPLTVSRGEDGHLVLEAPPRPHTAGMPMYFRADGQGVLLGRVALDTRREILVVNGPNALIDPTSGERLPPLVVEFEITAAHAELHTAAI